MIRLAAILVALAWLLSGSPGYQWATRLGCDGTPVVVTDAPGVFSSCEFGMAVVTLKGRWSYLEIDDERVIDRRVWFPQITTTTRPAGP